MATALTTSRPPGDLQRVLARARSLAASERWPAAGLLELQSRHAARLLAHARARVPHYRERAAEFPAAAAPGSAQWRAIPRLTRHELMRQPDRLRTPDWGPSQGHIYKVSSSGSTGEPVQVWRSELCREVWEAAALREHRWHERDAARSMAILRVGLTGLPPQGSRIPRGRPFDRIWRCGPTYAFDMTQDVALQAEWLKRMRPNYLLTYPANLDALLRRLGAAHGLGISQVIGVGGSVTQATRELCREVLGCGIAANYSSQEIGLVALQCPHCAQYHVQSEHVVVEVLDEAGEPCPPGSAGRLVITDLHNYLMPLIRYEIGDYAVAGGPCAGGIGLPALQEVLGRRRNMLVHADGRRHWPVTGFGAFRRAGAHRRRLAGR
jgi:phenylacetate-coenzyme A ligase PaaK-like adenylate-forming protein